MSDTAYIAIAAMICIMLITITAIIGVSNVENTPVECVEVRDDR